MRVITLWHARLTLFSVLVFFSMPIVYAASFALNATIDVTPYQLLLFGLIVMLILAVVFAALLYWRYPKWSKTLRLNYRQEYAWTFLITGFGALGSYLMIQAFWDVSNYFLLIIIPLVVSLYYGLYHLGRLVFHVPLFMRGDQ